MFADYWEDEPSTFIQDIAKAYCNERPLYRPNTSYIKVFFKWLFIECLIVAFAICIFRVSCITNFLALLPKDISNYINDDMVKACTIFALTISLIINLIISRWFAIDCVQLYQRYAPERVRRRCVLMPSCSEFAILALKHYGFILGCVMTYYRLTKRCRGTIYRIEYPKL